MTQPDDLFPSTTANYDSLAAHAARTQADWEAEMYGNENDRWGNVNTGLRGGLDLNYPLPVAIMRYIAQQLGLGGALATLDSVGAALNGFWSTLESSANTAGANATTAVNQISSMITNAATGTAAALGTALANTVTNVQNTWDRFWEGIFGGTASGKTAADLKTAAQTVNATAATGVANANTAQSAVAATNTALFGASTPASAIIPGAVPDVTRDMSSSTQAIINAINQLAGGSSSGSDEDSIRTALRNIPQGNIIPFASPAVSVTSDAGQTVSGWTLFYSAGGASGTQSVTGSHEVGSGANFAVVSVQYHLSTGNVNSAARSVTFGSLTMTSLGGQGLNGSLAQEFFGVYLPTPPSGAQTVTVSITPSGTGKVISLAAESASYCGVASVGAVVTAFVGAGSLTHTVTSATNNMVVQAFSMFNGSTGATLGSYNKSLRGDTGVYGGSPALTGMLFGDAAGASTVTFTATSTNGLSGNSAAINLLAVGGGIMGSGFRAYRASTTAVTSTTANTETKLTGSFFDTTSGSGTYNTSDLTYDTTTNKLTVSYAGWYTVTLTLSCSSSLAVSAFFWPILYINNTIARRGSSVYVPSGASNNGTFSTTWQVYLNSGDYLEPGAMRSTTGGAVLVGDSTGALSSFELALTNRSAY
ncbi:hypothetical protein [Mycobacterium sp. SA01]|uniref:hypothetical protein n=1 Tax=Mycobacterium sp. SA01 TaxID=3238820 RepID=UPI00351B76DC